MKLDWRHAAALTTAASVGVVAYAQCPDYTTYSQIPQGNASTGRLALPYMRPVPECRTFNSLAVETVITDMKSRLKDPDLARLFENTFPNTLDTTIRYFNATENLAFIITGDITYVVAAPTGAFVTHNRALTVAHHSAQWLRDTGNQLAPYHYLLPLDSNLAALFRAVINSEARYISQYPYCSAFQPPSESGLAPSYNAWAEGVTINPPVNNQTVFECKWELDSLCSFLKLSMRYYEATNDSSFMNENWKDAVAQIFNVIDEQSQSTFGQNFDFISYYNWTGGNGALSPAVNNEGNGEPKAYNGLVGTSHRPSDDLSVFAFLTPANAMLSVELAKLANALDSVGQLQNVSQLARQLSQRVHDAVWNHTLVENVFAYETNGLGSRYVMDDANVPSLLSLPYLGFLDRSNPAYVATRRLLLSRQNPYYAAGKNFSGIGGPHMDVFHPWPMSQISAIFGTDDDDEILNSLYLIANNTNGLGLIHESQSIYNQSDYTRSWFAWANSYFAEMMLDLAQRKPGLIFLDHVPYTPGR